MKLTQKHLDAWLLKWQKILRLQDWDIKVRAIRGVDEPDACGTCVCTLSKRMAFIRIVEPDDHAPSVWESDPEKTVVHELLHCHFAPFAAKEEDSLTDISQEQAIDAISISLITLDRNGRFRPHRHRKKKD